MSFQRNFQYNKISFTQKVSIISYSKNFKQLTVNHKFVVIIHFHGKFSAFCNNFDVSTVQICIRSTQNGVCVHAQLLRSINQQLSI